MNDYLKFRGRCKELAEKAVVEDPTLRLVRGYYYCPITNREEQHWWTVDPDGNIYDPSCAQFPSRGAGEYEEFTGVVTCEVCGVGMVEEEALFQGSHIVCRGGCYGILVGVS
jgi:hypothetical protein